MKKEILCAAFVLNAFLLTGATITSPSGNEGKDNENIEKSADHNYGSKWYSDFNRGLSWQQELPESRFFQSYSFVYANDYPDRDPKSWIVEGSNDGKAFVKIDEVNDYPSQLRFATRFFSIDDPGDYRFYRIQFLDNHGSYGFQLAEIEFSDAEVRDVAQKVNIPTATSPSGHIGKKGEEVGRTIDRNKRTKWFTPFCPGTSWQLELPENTQCSLYRLTSANDYPGRDPKSWIVEGSEDGKTFVKIGEENDVAFESRLQEKEFSIAAPGNYRFYRITFNTLADGNKDGFQIAEIEFK